MHFRFLPSPPSHPSSSAKCWLGSYNELTWNLNTSLIPFAHDSTLHFLPSPLCIAVYNHLSLFTGKDSLTVWSVFDLTSLYHFLSLLCLCILFLIGLSFPLQSHLTLMLHHLQLRVHSVINTETGPQWYSLKTIILLFLSQSIVICCLCQQYVL